MSLTLEAYVNRILEYRTDLKDATSEKRLCEAFNIINNNFIYFLNKDKNNNLKLEINKIEISNLKSDLIISQKKELELFKNDVNKKRKNQSVQELIDSVTK